ncbi:MAG TPA: PIG-L family deacetylase [Cyclobacteriaceae bacterium]|nr:PIG-L family deacetylase [Cyclobacteriaceae bacterium]
MLKIVLGIFAHPDDAEFMCAGTLALLKDSGWTVHIATMARGDKGTVELTREEISMVRKAEAVKAAGILDGIYHCLEFDDAFIFYDRESINKTTTLIRKIRPSLVFTSSPTDYMMDHEITSHIVQTACFCSGIKNMELTEDPFGPVPQLYYSDPMDGKDIFGSPVLPAIYVNITSSMQIKEKMLACHESQRNWLKTHHKVDEYILSMKRFAGQRGKEINVKYAEGFRQHLGHGYPQENILKNTLGELVLTKKNSDRL